MITYPISAQGVTWTPVGAGEAETLFTVKDGDNETILSLPVRVTTHTETTKAGITRTVIKVAVNVAENLLYVDNTSTAVVGSAGGKTVPIEAHVVVSAPKGLAQIERGPMQQLLYFLLENLQVLVRGDASDDVGREAGEAGTYPQLLNAMRGKQAIDVFTGIYGNASTPEAGE